MFILDMGLMFTTSYINSQGVEISNSPKIALQYLLSTRFLFDLFAVLGSGVITYFEPKMKVFGIFKLLRIVRLGTLIARLNFHEETKALLNLMKLTFFLCLLVHFSSCFWFLICKANKDMIDEDGRRLVWYPPTDFVNYQESDLFDEDQELTHQLMVSLYTAILMLGSNEIAPVNVSEIAFCIFMLLFSSVINAQLFGEMAVLISTIMKKYTLSQMRIDSANSVMNESHIPLDLQADIHDFLHMTQDTRDKQVENDRFFSIISPSLKVIVQQKIFESNLRKNISIINIIGSSQEDQLEKSLTSRSQSSIRKKKTMSESTIPGEDKETFDRGINQKEI